MSFWQLDVAVWFNLQWYFMHGVICFIVTPSFFLFSLVLHCTTYFSIQLLYFEFYAKGLFPKWNTLPAAAVPSLFYHLYTRGKYKITILLICTLHCKIIAVLLDTTNTWTSCTSYCINVVDISRTEEQTNCTVEHNVHYNGYLQFHKYLCAIQSTIIQVYSIALW